MIYTTIIHEIRKELKLTNNEYCILDWIYNISNSKKYKWNVNNTYLADIYWLTRATVITIRKKLDDMWYTSEEWLQEYWDMLLWKNECKEIIQPSVKKLDSKCKETIHNNNIYINNNKNNNINIIITKIYDKYIELFKTDIKYRYKSKVVLYLTDLLKEYNEEQLIQSVILYHRSMKWDIKYALSPKNFFSNSKRNEKYRVFEDYLWDLDNSLNQSQVESITDIWF